ncbi:MAG: hypothetical protein AB1597_03595 [Chloroflexota bacterium]
MDLEHLLSQVLNLVGTYTSQMALMVFLICLISEGLGLTIPYLLETTWLITGYQVSRGGAPFNYLIMLVLTAQAGRQIGSLLFFYLSRLSAGPLMRLAKFVRLKSVVTRSSELFRKVNLLSPFSVAIGRLLGLRIPITIILGANRKLKTLALGILLSSLAFDGTYLALGSIVGTTVINPIYVFVCFFIGLLLMYGVAIIFRRSGRLMLDRVGGGQTAQSMNDTSIPSWVGLSSNSPVKNQSEDKTETPQPPPK